MAIPSPIPWIPVFLVQEEPAEDLPETRRDTVQRERSPTHAGRTICQSLGDRDDPGFF